MEGHAGTAQGNSFENNVLAQAKKTQKGVIDAQTVEDEKPENKKIKLGYTYGELLNKKIEPRQEIIFGLGRGEVGLMNAVNNAGKTTILRNLLISLCVGKWFNPFGKFGTPRKVAFLDFEDSLTYLRADIQKMSAVLDKDQLENLKENALFVCEFSDGQGEDLSLSKLGHIDLITERLKEFKPDLIIVDTISSAFEIRDENNNAEVRKYIMSPLRRLARGLNSALLATHHIGKPKGEEGQTREASFRGRGASSFADMAKLVLNLEKDSINGTANLGCAKVKGKPFEDVRFELNISNRWFELKGKIEQVSNYKTFLSAFDDGKEYRTAELIDGFKKTLSARTVKDYLPQAMEKGDIVKVKHGVYQSSKASKNT